MPSRVSKALVGIVQPDFDGWLCSIIMAGDNLCDACEKFRTNQPLNFWPIAGLKFLYNTFAYMLLNRVDAFLEPGQPEEQHGFKTKHRVEEHLLTENLVLDKAKHANVRAFAGRFHTNRQRLETPQYTV